MIYIVGSTDAQLYGLRIILVKISASFHQFYSLCHLMQVAQALQSSKHAMLESQTSIEEVELCLQELDENISALKRLDIALGKHLLSDFSCFAHVNNFFLLSSLKMTPE